MTHAKKKILVLGGSSRLARAFYTRAASRFDIAMIQRHPDNNRAPQSHIVESYDRLPPRCLEGTDLVLNCVGSPDARLSAKELDYVNAEIPLHIMRAAQQNGVGHFVQLSSLSVYGGAESINAETAKLPRSPYGKSKLRAEQELTAQAGSMRLSLLRIPILYGHGAGEKLLRLTRAIHWLGWFPAARSHPLRSMLHIDNAAAILEHVISQELGGPLFAADTENFEIEFLADAIRRQTARRISIYRVPDALLRPLSAVAPGLYASLYRASVIAPELNLSNSVKIPIALGQGLRNLVAEALA